MHINPYVNFNGQCEAAFKFYERVLGGKITFQMTWGEMPGADQFPAETHKLIMHATLNVGDQVLMGADAPRGVINSPKGRMYRSI
jgi:PhnB protein